MASWSRLYQRSGANTISESALRMGEVCAEIEPIGGVRVRPWRTSDAEVLVDAWHDPEIGRWNPVPADRTLEFAAAWIEGTSSQTVASVGIDVVIVDAADRIFGEIGFQVDPGRKIAELGFWIASAHRAHGHGRSLLGLSVALAERLELVGLVAITDAANAAAVALLETSGWIEVPTTSARRTFARRLAA